MWVASLCAFVSHMSVQPTRLFIQSACLSLRDSKCSKWWNSNITNKLSLLILFILFPSVEIQKCVMYGCALENNVFTAIFGIPYNLSLPEYKPDYHCVRFLKTRQLQVHPPLNFLTLPDWLKC
jgi:hypothetical protein